MALTVELLKEATRLLRDGKLNQPIQPRIMFSIHALKDSNERLFPTSKHRSKRIEKKLLKRFGAYYRKQPCMWQVGDTIYAHPSFANHLKANSLLVP